MYLFDAPCYGPCSFTLYTYYYWGWQYLARTVEQDMTSALCQSNIKITKKQKKNTQHLTLLYTSRNTACNKNDQQQQDIIATLRIRIRGAHRSILNNAPPSNRYNLAGTLRLRRTARFITQSNLYNNNS